MSVAVHAPAFHQDIEPASIDAGSIAAAICFQSAGQVVTVLGKLDRHFQDNTDLASFTKRAVAEYAAKRETQIISVVVTKDFSGINEDDATKQITIGKEHYAVTIGDLHDGRTQMDHINRVIERLKYLQAVMVMLSTTDMLGTSQALGKQMGGLNAKVQQVQKLGVKLEQFAKQVTQAQKEGKPMPAEALKPILTQLNRLNTTANPPEIRKIVQTMLSQVKELRQLPIMRQAVVQTQTAKTQLHVAARNDAPVKTETRFKVPLKLVASKDSTQSPRAMATGTEPVKVTRHFTVLTPARAEQIQTRIVNTASVNQAARVQPIVLQAKNDNRFRAVPQPLVKAVETRQALTPISERTNATPIASQRFSVVSNAVKEAPVLTTLAQTNRGIVAPIAGSPQNHVQAIPAAVVQPVSVALQTVQRTVPQASPQVAQPAVQQVIPQATVQTAPQVTPQTAVQVAPQTIPVEQRQNEQPKTVQPANTVTEQAKPVVQAATQTQPVAQTIPQPAETAKTVVQQAVVQQPKSPTIEVKQTIDAKAPTGDTNLNRVGTGLVSESQQPPQPVDSGAKLPPKTLPDTIGRGDNDNPTARGAERVGTPAKSPNEPPPVGTSDQAINRQQPKTPEGDDKKQPKTSPTIVQQFKDCGCGNCGKNAKTGQDPSTRAAPASTPPATGQASLHDPKVIPIKTQIGEAKKETCQGGSGCPLCNPANDNPEQPKGKVAFARRTNTKAQL